MVRAATWSPRSIRLFDLLGAVAGQVSVQKIEVLDACYVYGVNRVDQTLLPTGDPAIKVMRRRRTAGEADQTAAS